LFRDAEFVAKNFPRLRRIGLDANVIGKVDPRELIRAAPKYASAYTCEDHVCLLTATGMLTVPPRKPPEAPRDERTPPLSS
jgi:hypothetical protein